MPLDRIDLRSWLRAVTDLGEVSSADAASYFLSLAESGSGGRGSQGAITAAVVGIIAMVIANFVPETERAKFWPGLTWPIPLACMVTIFYVIRGFFI